MEAILKFGAISIVSAVLCLVIKRYHPEFALLLSFASAVFFICGALETTVSIKASVLKWLDELYVPRGIYSPLIKCVGISVVTQFVCNISKDAGQASAAFALELLGNLLCALCMLPLIEHLFLIIEELV